MRHEHWQHKQLACWLDAIVDTEDREYDRRDKKIEESHGNSSSGNNHSWEINLSNHRGVGQKAMTTAGDGIGEESPGDQRAVEKERVGNVCCGKADNQS